MGGDAESVICPKSYVLLLFREAFVAGAASACDYYAASTQRGTAAGDDRKINRSCLRNLRSQDGRTPWLTEPARLEIGAKCGSM